MMTHKSSGGTILLQLPPKWLNAVVIAALGLVIGIGTTACRERSGATATGRAWPAAVGHPEQRAAKLDIRILRNPGFVVGYGRNRGRAAWVAYRATPVTDFSRMPRPEFKPDPRVSFAAPRRIYWGPEYDRGHLAPNYAMAQLYGAAAQHASFYFSNVVPQTQRLNQLLWQRLEEIEIDRLAPRLDTLWVLDGPIHGGSQTQAPVAFFRIWLARGSEGQWQVMAFRVPQDVRGDERLSRFLVSVDAVEQATGLDFFSELPAAREQAIEARRAEAQRWGFAAFACMPARYSEDWQNRGGIHLNFDRCD